MKVHCDYMISNANRVNPIRCHTEVIFHLFTLFFDSHDFQFDLITCILSHEHKPNVF